MAIHDTHHLELSHGAPREFQLGFLGDWSLASNGLKITHADHLACAGGGECGGVVWGRVVPDRCGGPQFLFAGGDGFGRTAKCGAHRSVGAGQILRAARGLHGGGVGAATAARWRLGEGTTFALGIGRGVGARLCGRVLAAAQIGGAEPATARGHDFRRGTHGVGAAIRDVAWGFTSR
jgi:hypothetical protein